MPNKSRHPGFIAAYDAKTEALSAAGAISLTKRTTTLSVTGTMAFTVAAPRFAGQYKFIVEIPGGASPVANITVTGMRGATQDVWTFSGFVPATAPRSLLLYSPDGIVWDAVAHVGATVA